MDHPDRRRAENKENDRRILERGDVLALPDALGGGERRGGGAAREQP